MLDFLCIALGGALILIGGIAFITPGVNYSGSTFLGNLLLAIILINMGLG